MRSSVCLLIAEAPGHSFGSSTARQTAAIPLKFYGPRHLVVRHAPFWRAPLVGESGSDGGRVRCGFSRFMSVVPGSPPPVFRLHAAGSL